MFIENLNTYIFIEQYKYKTNCISEGIINIFRNYDGVMIRKAEIWFTITGFIVFDNTLITILPKGYNIDDDKSQILENVRLLFAVLMKYHNESNLLPEESIIIGGGIGDINSSIFSAYNLIEDFKINGILKRNISSTTTKYNGNVDWSSTINKKTPIHSNGNIIYNSAIYKKNIQDRNNLLVKLHKYVVYKSIIKYGWLLGIDQDDIDMYYIKRPCDIYEGLRFLEKELIKTYIHREVNVIKWIINMLKEKDNQSVALDIELLATKSYYYVWEAVCSKIFKNQYIRLKELLPQPKWSFFSDRKSQKISHRPDILVIKNNRFYILDAKYYNSEINLPGWHDVDKQFFYCLSIKKYITNNYDLIEDNALKHDVINIISYENAFVLPTYNTDKVINIGNISVPNIADYGHINTFIINARLAMECYIGEKEYNFLNKIETMIT